MDDPGNIGPGFHVVDVRRLAPESFDRREGRTGTRHAPLSFNGRHERCLFSAHKSSGTFLDVKGEIKVSSENVFTEKPVVCCLSDGGLEPLDGQRVLGPAINIAFIGSHGVGADHHPFDDGMRVAFQDGTVHERTGVSFVGIADNIFLISRRSRAETPFQPGGESAAAAAAQARLFHFIDHLGR